MRRFLLSVLGLAALLFPRNLPAAASTAWETSGFTDLLRGRLTGLSLTADGVLTPGPAQRFSVALGQPALWSLAVGPDGSVYAATGHAGKVFRVDANGGQSLLWSSEQAEVFAIAVDRRGRVFAGSSPNGGVYRIENGQARLVWKSPAKYIWSLAISADDHLYVGTGETGRIFRLDLDGQGGPYYETEQGNVTALQVGGNGRLYAGTEPNGLVYEVTGPNRGTVIYDSSLPEIRSVVPMPDGSLYVAAMGGAVSTRTGTATAAGATAATTAVTASTPTVITVTEAAGQNTQAGTARTTANPSAAASTPQATANQAASVTEVAGVDKSAIYRIGADRTVETLRTSKDDNVYDLAWMGDALLFSTDDHGRVYRLDGPKTTLVVEAGDGEATRLVPSGNRFYVALSNSARVLGFDPTTRAAANYVSQVHDSGSVARWGHLQWRGSNATGLRFQTRTGNAVRPDATWSAWSAAIEDSQRALIASPIARYVQWRAEWPEGSRAECSGVTVPYLAQNGAPIIRSIAVSSVSGTNPAKASAAAAGSSSAYSITVTDTGEAPAATTTAGGGQMVSRLQTTQTQVSWQADDPDSDKLVFALYFKPEEAHEWQLIRSRMSENTLLLDPDVFADGRYLFRVVASDAPVNAAQYARQAELVSSAVLIDNTPPVVTVGKPNRQGTVVDLEVAAIDATSSLRKCEYSLDGGYWQTVEAEDGITDTPSERFALHLEKLKPGEHLVVVRVYDGVGNAGLARTLLP